MTEFYDILGLCISPLEDIQDLENDIKTDCLENVESCQATASLEELMQDIANQEKTIEEDNKYI